MKKCEKEKDKEKSLHKEKLINLLLVCCLVLFSIVKAAGVWKYHPGENKFVKHMEAGAEYVAEEYYVEAIEEFDKADAINPCNETKLSIAECYLMLGDMVNFKQAADEAEKLYGMNERLCTDLVYYYSLMNDKPGMIALLDAAVDEYPDNEYLCECYDLIKGDYTEVGNAYDEAYALQGGYDVVLFEGEYKIISDEMMEFGNICFEGVLDILPGEEMRVSALKDGRIRYYDSQGYMRHTPGNKYKYLGTYRDGYALMQNSKGWAYIDDNEWVVSEMYDEATAFTDGIAAVKKNGKWKLIDTEFNEITNSSYDDVIRDENHCIVFAGRIFVSEKNQYTMLDTKGDKVASGYKEVNPFMEEDGYAAVRDASGWKVIDRNGECIEKIKCDELLASGNNMMPYRIGDKWGYIGVCDGVYVHPEFDQALRVNPKGYAAVRQGSQWKYIYFTRFQ